MSLARRSLLVGLIAISFGLSSLPPVAHATLLFARSLSVLSNESTAIVVVTALTETSRWDESGRIVSDMQLRVTDVVKGNHHIGDTISVARLGGTVGEVAMTVAGEAHLFAGERAVMFVEQVNDEGLLRVTNMSLGQFPIVMLDGVETVLPSGAGLSLVVAGDDGSLTPSVAPLQSSLPLRDFLSVVRQVVRAR